MSWPSICILLTFFMLFDAMIVSLMVSLLHFFMFSLPFFLMVCIFLGTPFVVYCRRFPPFLAVSSPGLVLVMISSILVAC